MASMQVLAFFNDAGKHTPQIAGVFVFMAQAY